MPCRISGINTLLWSIDHTSVNWFRILKVHWGSRPSPWVTKLSRHPVWVSLARCLNSRGHGAINHEDYAPQNNNIATSTRLTGDDVSDKSTKSDDQDRWPTLHDVVQILAARSPKRIPSPREIGNRSIRVQLDKQWSPSIKRMAIEVALSRQGGKTFQMSLNRIWASMKEVAAASMRIDPSRHHSKSRQTI